VKEVQLTRHSAAPTLFIVPGATGFVSQINGEVKLRRALVPIDFSPRADIDDQLLPGNSQARLRSDWALKQAMPGVPMASEGQG
jgi:hypothetical protein